MTTTHEHRATSAMPFLTEDGFQARQCECDCGETWVETSGMRG